MQIENKHPNNNDEDLTWCLLSECSLGKLFLEKDREVGLSAKLLFQSLSESGLPHETLTQIENVIACTINKVVNRFNRGSPNVTVELRVFCQRRMLSRVHRVKTSMNLDEEQFVKSAEQCLDAEPELHGGWGYFLIERGKDFPIASTMGTLYIVELYLYNLSCYLNR